MKSIDEVVEMAEHCWKPMPKGTCDKCPSRQRAGNCNLLAQALYYLREYRDVKNAAIEEIERRLAFLHSTSIYNPPLSWDELKAMEGKPVWIEHLETGTPHGEWTIVQTPAAFGDVYLVTRYRDRYVLYEKDLSKTWQAYRKEKNSGQ